MLQQSLHAYHDEIVAASYTANIPDNKRVELVYTAFIYGLRHNQHMHRWVTRRDTIGTIESALEIAEIYEEEFGSDSILQSRPVTVSTRDSTGNALAVRLPEPDDLATVSVDAVQTESSDMRWQKEFKQLHTHIDQKFDDFDARMLTVEKYQAAQMRRWDKSKNNPKNYDKKRDGNNRGRNWNDNRENRSNNQQDGNNQQNSGSGGAPNGSNNKQGSNGNQRQWKNKDSSQEINARESSGLNAAAGEE